MVQHGLVKKKRKANFMDSRKHLLRGYKFKETKHDRFAKRSAAIEAEEIDGGGRERPPQVDRAVFFFIIFFLQSSNNFRFAFLALTVASQAFT